MRVRRMAVVLLRKTRASLLFASSVFAAAPSNPITIPLAKPPAIGANKTLTFASSTPLYCDLGATTVSTPGIVGDNSDPDGDGISNLIEYFQGTIARSLRGRAEMWLQRARCCCVATIRRPLDISSHRAATT